MRISACSQKQKMPIAAKHAAAIACFLPAASQATGGQPLKLAIYLDEVTPGNVLRPENHRKFWSFYVAFVDCKPELLHREQMWIPIAVLRSSIAHQVKGGISQCTRQLVRTMLLDPCNMAGVGFALTLSTPTLVRAQLRYFIADEAALKAVWSSKGAAGCRCCLLCKNVVSINSGLADEVGSEDYLVNVSCAEVERFDMATDADIHSAFDRLARDAGRLKVGAFKQLEKAVGFTYNADSILADQDLRALAPPASITYMDWMHNMVQHGTANVEFELFLRRCKETLGIRYAHVNTFVTAAWVWPANQSNHSIDSVFTQSKEKTAPANPSVRLLQKCSWFFRC